MTFTKIQLEKEDGIAKISLNRPEVMNAIDGELLLELKVVIDEITNDETVRAVVITGEGKAFSTGADLTYLKNFLNDNQRLLDFLRLFHQVVNTIEKCPKPIIAAVNGFALAGGLELTNACDLVIAAEDARLGDQHANYGLVPGGGNTQRLPRLIGLRRAKELLLTGNWLSAGEAQKLGLVNQVVPGDRLMAEAVELAVQIAEKSPLALSMVKNLVNQGIQTDLTTALELELITVLHELTSEDASEGIKAFEEKRKPIFKGR